MNIFREYEEKAVKHSCQQCKTNFCKPHVVKKCPFCGSSRLIIVLSSVRRDELGGTLARKKQP